MGIDRHIFPTMAVNNLSCVSLLTTRQGEPELEQYWSSFRELIIYPVLGNIKNILKDNQTLGTVNAVLKYYPRHINPQLTIIVFSICMCIEDYPVLGDYLDFRIPPTLLQLLQESEINLDWSNI